MYVIGVAAVVREQPSSRNETTVNLRNLPPGPELIQLISDTGYVLDSGKPPQIVSLSDSQILPNWGLLSQVHPVIRYQIVRPFFDFSRKMVIGDRSSRQGWEFCRVKVPVLSITCSQTASISGACGGNEARSARM